MNATKTLEDMNSKEKIREAKAAIEKNKRSSKEYEYIRNSTKIIEAHIRHAENQSREKSGIDKDID